MSARMARRRLLACALAAAAMLPASAPLRADDPTASALPAALRDVGIDRRIGEPLPLDVQLRDEQGRPVRLGQFFGRRPVIVVPVYYRCPMLCQVTLQGLTRSLKVLTFGARDDYELVVFSFDPNETPADAAKKKAEALSLFGQDRASAGWHFLTGDREAVQRLTRALGFRYVFDAGRGEFVHASTLVLATPQGKISRYLYTTEPTARDLRLALVEASAGKLGTLADQVLLYCYKYDATTGRYTMLTMRLVRAGGALTVLLLGLFIGAMVRQERRGARARAAALEGLS